MFSLLYDDRDGALVFVDCYGVVSVCGAVVQVGRGFVVFFSVASLAVWLGVVRVCC